MTDIIGRKNEAKIRGSAAPHSGETGEWGQQLLRARIAAAIERNKKAAAGISNMIDAAAWFLEHGEPNTARLYMYAAEIAVIDEAQLEKLRQLLRLCEGLGNAAH